jgi:hypothetical protein
MDPKDEDKFDFDPLDVTKVWPEHLFPLQPVGRMVLNKNPDNFFTENEQLAFCPALIVPGARPCLLRAQPLPCRSGLCLCWHPCSLWAGSSGLVSGDMAG